VSEERESVKCVGGGGGTVQQQRHLLITVQVAGTLDASFFSRRIDNWHKVNSKRQQATLTQTLTATATATFAVLPAQLFFRQL